MASKQSIKVKKSLPDIKIVEKYSPPIIEFETVEAFMEYLADHKEELDKQTTQRLNKQYRVTG
jgi:hypothetical protein